MFFFVLCVFSVLFSLFAFCVLCDQCFFLLGFVESANGTYEMKKYQLPSTLKKTFHVVRSTLLPNRKKRGKKKTSRRAREDAWEMETVEEWFSYFFFVISHFAFPFL